MLLCKGGTLSQPYTVDFIGRCMSADENGWCTIIHKNMRIFRQAISSADRQLSGTC